MQKPQIEKSELQPLVDKDLTVRAIAKSLR